ncbi:AsmA family protein [Rubripirellula reticaptiva]|uniref:Uncharacterized protein n=1 Tax=Rubripirellula reticaptiva TaxID=2528013 RepID=A0A5C6EL85_9BACT|nr:AsmA-like C-terminal region-containing protein [Rubripirellula reticaptiva]TWU48029.1 hypothetical protein Poly59_48730 [Rubripirellula reticaptiva]
MTNCVSRRIPSIGRLPFVACLTWVCLTWACSGVAMAQQAEKPAARVANQPRYWTTEWSLSDIDVGKLANRLELIGIETGLDLSGTVSVEFQVGIPMTSLRDASAYRFDGTLTSPSLEVDGVLLKELRTHVVYRDGVATLQNLNSQIIDRERPEESTGSIEGTATAQLVPRKDLSADVTVTDLAVAPLAELIAKLLGRTDDRLPSDGKFSGNAKFNVPLETASEIATYRLDGKFSGRGLRIANLPPADFDADHVEIEEERLVVDRFTLSTGTSDNTAETIRLLGNASLPLSKDGGDFHFAIDGDDVPIGNVVALMAQQNGPDNSSFVSGKIDFRLMGDGKLADKIAQSSWNIRGSVASPKLSVAGVDLGTVEHDIELTPTVFNVTSKRDTETLPKSFRLIALKSAFTIGDESLVIKQIDATLFDGNLSGSATIPFVESGTATAKLELDGIQPRIELSLAGRKTIVTAGIEGNLDWQVPMGKVDQPDQHSGQARLSVTGITIGDTDVGAIKAVASAEAGKISLNANGRLFDGSVTVATTANMQAGDRWSDVTSRLAATVIEFDEVKIDRLIKDVTTSTIEVTGLVSGKVSVSDWNTHAPDKVELPSADVQLEISRFSHRSRLLSRSMRLEGKLRNNIFDVASLVGDYAEGSTHARGRVYLIDESGTLHPRADLRVSANRVNLAQSLWFLGDTAEDYQGRASVSATVAGYQDSIRVRGSADGRELSLYGLPLGKAHSGLMAEANVGRKSWKVRFPSVRSTQGGGQVEGALALNSTRSGGRGIDMESRWNTRRVDIFRLSNEVGRSTSLARGEITGDISLNGKSIQNLADLSGRFNFSLGQTRGAGIPGLVAVSRFLGPISLVNQTFNVGEAKGIIGGGAITVDEFWLGSDAALVQADGKVYIQGGRLDMNALIATGDYRDIAANFAQLAQQYALRTLLPTSAILDVTELLRDRTLVVRVMGTLGDPIIRVQPVQTFREETARFLLREGQRLVLAGITVGAADGLTTK